MSRPLSESLIRDNLYNWFGYGNPNGDYWFIGREEYDSIDKCRHINDIREYYEARREFEFAEDFVDVWENVYGRHVEQGSRSMTTRHVQAAFLLAFQGESPTGQDPDTGRSKTSSFVFSQKRFGRRDGNHFSGEIFPLRYHPNDPSTFDPYRDVWNSPTEYEDEVLPRRIEVFLECLRGGAGPEVVISYAESREFFDPVKEEADVEDLGTLPANKANEFDLVRCGFEPGTDVILVDSPFFGQGHIGYNEIEVLAETIHSLRGTGPDKG